MSLRAAVGVAVFCLVAFAAAGRCAEREPPSHAPFNDCAWERIEDAGAGLRAWVQRCDYGFRKIDFVFSGHSLAQRFDAGVADPLVDVLDLEAGETPEAGLRRLFAERSAPALAQKCVLKPYRYYKGTRRGIKRYTFAPDAQFRKQLDATQDPDEVPEPPCGDWGDAPDGIQYFEVQPNSRQAHRVLFVRVGQDEPLFDEQTLRILPAR